MDLRAAIPKSANHRRSRAREDAMFRVVRGHLVNEVGSTVRRSVLWR